MTRDGKRSIVAASSGDSCPAGFLPLPLGNVHKHSVVDSYRDQPLRREICAARCSGRCGRCEHATLCGGSRARAYSGTDDGERVAADEFRRRVASDMEEVVRRQLAAGVDVGGDGELPRIGFSFYVKDRMSGFGGVSPRGTFADMTMFPGYAALRSGATVVVDEGKDMTKNATLYDIPAAVGKIVGDPTRVLACTDCGFSTFAGYVMVAEDVAWAKLATLAAGAQLASERLFH